MIWLQEKAGKKWTEADRIYQNLPEVDRSGHQPFLWAHISGKRRKWLSNGLIFCRHLFRATRFLRPGTPGFAMTVVIWCILQPGCPRLGMTLPLWLICIRIRRDPEWRFISINMPLQRSFTNSRLHAFIPYHTHRNISSLRKSILLSEFFLTFDCRRFLKYVLRE